MSLPFVVVFRIVVGGANPDARDSTSRCVCIPCNKDFSLGAIGQDETPIYVGSQILQLFGLQTALFL